METELNRLIELYPELKRLVEIKDLSDNEIVESDFFWQYVSPSVEQRRAIVSARIDEWKANHTYWMVNGSTIRRRGRFQEFLKSRCDRTGVPVPVYLFP